MYDQQTKTTQFLTIETLQRPFDVVIIDIIGPCQKTQIGNVYAVTLLSDFSKYLVADAVFEHHILVCGPMKCIESTDRGTEYKNELIVELCKLMRIKHNISTAYHHESVGPVERNH